MIMREIGEMKIIRKKAKALMIKDPLQLAKNAVSKLNERIQEKLNQIMAHYEKAGTSLVKVEAKKNLDT